MNDRDTATNGGSREGRDTDWIRALGGAIGVGVAVIAILGFTNEEFGRWTGLFAGLFLAGASGVTGGFLGFLFAIPRASQAQGPARSEGGKEARVYLENTNLEQVSDWLTKIIVGLTLVQSQTIIATLLKVGERYGPVLITHDHSAVPQVVAVAAIIYFLVIGFLFSYLWTRIYMEALLRLQNAQLDSEIRKIFEHQQQKLFNADANALELVDKYLDKNATPGSAEFDGLADKVAASSVMARTMIFDKAQKVRRDNWREDGNRALVDRVVPIFEGLIAAAPEKHRNYGQLGYALVTKVVPDWEKAKQTLETAIRLRGENEGTGRGYYEFNLALALINLDKNFNEKRPTDKDIAMRIAALLDKGREVIDLKTDPTLAAWGKLNAYAI